MLFLLRGNKKNKKDQNQKSKTKDADQIMLGIPSMPGLTLVGGLCCGMCPY